MDWLRGPYSTNPKMPVWTDTPSEGSTNLNELLFRKNKAQTNQSYFDDTKKKRRMMQDRVMQMITKGNPELSPLHRMMLLKMLQQQQMGQIDTKPQYSKPGWM